MAPKIAPAREMEENTQLSTLLRSGLCCMSSDGKVYTFALRTVAHFIDDWHQHGMKNGFVL